MSLTSFITNLHLQDNMLTKMFEDKLSPRTKDRVSVLRLRKFRDFIKASLITESNQTKA